MKKRITLITLLALCAATLFAQAPEKFSYQAVVRNASNALVTNAQVGVRVSILQGSANGNAVYVETHTATTNTNGLLTIEIGGGTLQQGDFANIDWANGSFFLKTETDPNGGNNYSVTSTQQLLSVPYALYAKDAGNVPTVPANVSAFTNDAGYITAQDIPEIPTVPTNVSAFVNDVPYITSFTEQQILTISNDTIFLTGGSFVKLPAGFDGDYNSLTNTPDIPTVPTDVSAFINDAGYLTSFTEQQVLSISNDTIFLTGGSFVKLPAGFDGDYNSLTNTPDIPTVPSDVSVFNNDANYVSNTECADVDLCTLAALVSSLQGQLTGLQGQLAELQSTIDSLTVPDTTVTPVDTATLSTVITGAVSYVTETTAMCGGNVTADGGANVTARGVCWSTSQNPTINNSHTTDGSGTGSFTSNLTGLTAGTTYYVRAYATNSEGTAYGSQVTFTTHLDSTQLYHNFIGTTYYDLQSNGSVSNKIVAHSDGTVSAVWITNGSTTSSRGTGYNYFDGTSWINSPSNTDRIENVRTGWGTMTSVGDAEIMAAHNSTTGLEIGVCPQKGTNNWIFTTLQGPAVSNGFGISTCLFWPALASSGNIIHLIACTESSTGYLYQGIQTCLVYYRGTFDTLNNTISWEDPRIVGNVTSAEVKSFSGDTYAIAAKGNTVAIVSASEQSDVFLWKSSDNGMNFTKTTIFQHPYPGFDETTTLVLDTPYVADGTCAVALSDNGTAHVAFGITRFLNDDIADNNWSYFPGIAAILYWNETQQPILNTDATTLNPENIADAGYTVFGRSDLNNDGGAYWPANITNFPTYGIGSVSTPQIVVDGNNVYVVYTAILDWPFLDVSSSSYYRGVFARKSTDGGANFGDVSWLSYNIDCYYIYDWAWTQNTEYTFDDMSEYIYSEGESVFPAVAPEIVNGKLIITWQQDYTAGCEIKENNTAMAQNESKIYFLSIDANDVGVYNNTNEISQGLWNDGTGFSNRVISGMQMQPDSESESVNITSSFEESSNADSSVVNSMDGSDRQHPKCEK